MFVHLSINLSIYLTVYLYINLSICLSICLFISLTFYLKDVQKNVYNQNQALKIIVYFCLISINLDLSTSLVASHSNFACKGGPYLCLSAVIPSPHSPQSTYRVHFFIIDSLENVHKKLDVFELLGLLGHRYERGPLNSSFTSVRPCNCLFAYLKHKYLAWCTSIPRLFGSKR